MRKPTEADRRLGQEGPELSSAAWEEQTGLERRKIASRCFILGMIAAQIAEEGRGALRAATPRTLADVTATLPEPVSQSLIAAQIAWRLDYYGGDAAILTWTETNEKEQLMVPEDGSKLSDLKVDEATRASLWPTRLPQ